jgi:hypothetical protein
MYVLNLLNFQKMKKVFKFVLVLVGFALAVVASTDTVQAIRGGSVVSVSSRGGCFGDNHVCGVTSSGTVLNGNWIEPDH